jgi:hypothetical protein
MASAETPASTLTRLTHPRQILLARLVWGLGIGLVLALFVYSLLVYPSEFQKGCLCDALVRIDLDATGYRLVPRSAGSAVGLIQPGDVLLAMDETPITPAIPRQLVLQLFDSGSINSTSTLTIRTGDDAPREVHLTRSRPAYWVMSGALSFGWSPDVATVYVLVLEIATMLGFLIVAGLIAWRSSTDWMALFAAWAMVATGFAGGQLLTGLRIYSLTPPPVFDAIWYFKGAIYTLMYLFVLVFPEGKFRPRWTLLLVVGFAVWQVFLRLNAAATNRIILDLAILAFIVAFMGASVYRYRRYFTLVQRQQTKWALYGLAVSMLATQLIASITTVLALNASLDTAVRFFFIAYPLSRLALLVIPLTFAFAALRYRLYDINIVINRSLVYGVVTVLMAGVFLGGSFILRQLLGDEQSALAFAVSVLGAGLLFNPARQRAQHLIDRYFYGFRFDLNQLERVQHPPTLAMRSSRAAGLMTGRTLGRYQVLEMLGRGGMGEVYYGEAPGEQVAIKILHTDLVQESEYLKRFEREA